MQTTRQNLEVVDCCLDELAALAKSEILAASIQTELDRFSACPSNFQQCDYGYDDDDTSDTWWLIWRQPNRLEPDAEGICYRLGVQLSFDRQVLRVVNYLEDYLNFNDTHVVEVCRFGANEVSEVAGQLVSFHANLLESDEAIDSQAEEVDVKVVRRDEWTTASGGFSEFRALVGQVGEIFYAGLEACSSGGEPSVIWDQAPASSIEDALRMARSIADEWSESE